MSCEFDLFVPPLSCSVMASDQASAVEAAEVTVDEGVSRFRLLRGSFRETEMPLAIFIPGVRLQKCVLVTGAWLDVARVAAEARQNQRFGAAHRRRASAHALESLPATQSSARVAAAGRLTGTRPRSERIAQSPVFSGTARLARSRS